VLEFALLGLLKDRPMHGYDLRKHLREEFGPLQHLSFGSLYPALGRLESTGEIRAIETDAAAAAPIALTGSLAGERAAAVARRANRVAAVLGGHGTRAKKVYEITPAGEELFERLLEAPGRIEDPRDFALRLAFARHLAPAARVRLLERQRTELAERLERAGRLAVAPTRPLDVYEKALADHARDTIAGELAWVEQLLATEIAAGIGNDADKTNVGMPRASEVRSAEGLVPAAAATSGNPDGGKV
jgi:DNA-binding PadR family transcriptional regulator